MQDQFKRKINYMRLSLTDRCNLRCLYCRPDTGFKISHEDILRYEEILRVCRAAAALGITRFKITGGEPLLRRDCADFIAVLKAVPGVEQVTMTTNGALFKPLLPSLLRAGLDSVNFSLDTMDSQAYYRLTGGRLEPVLEALEAAYQAGMSFKLNCVPLSDFTVRQLLDLLKLAERYQAPLRFIELMPLACHNGLQGLTEAQLRQLFSALDLCLLPDERRYGNGPAAYYHVSGFSIPIGFIEPLRHRFCGACNRIRLTAAGELKTCLYSQSGLDVRGLLRSGCSDADLQAALQKAVYNKPEGHKFSEKPGGFAMNSIGG